MADDAQTDIVIDNYGRRRNAATYQPQGKPPDPQSELKSKVELLTTMFNELQQRMNQLDIAATTFDIQSPDHNVNGSFKRGFQITQIQGPDGGLQPGQQWYELTLCDGTTIEVIARNITPPP